MSVGSEQEWAQPRHRGRPLVAVTVAASTTISVLLLLALPDLPRRWAVGGLLVLLLAVQAVQAMRARRAGRRPLSPKWLRWAAMTGFFWGTMTSLQYLLLGPEQSGASSVVTGTLTAAIFGLIMWFADPAGSTPTDTPGTRASTRGGGSA